MLTLVMQRLGDPALSDKVGGDGAVAVKISYGDNHASGSGRLNGTSGEGRWSGGACAGSWTAERR